MTSGESTETGAFDQAAVQPAGRRVRLAIRPSHLRGTALPFGTFVLLIATWAIVVAVFDMPSYLVPSPRAVGASLVDDASLLWNQSMPTLEEIVYGFLISVAIGIPLGILLAESKFLRDALYPLLVVTQIVPKLAFGPLFLVWFGFGLQPKLLMVVLISFFPILLDTMTGVMSASAEFKELARILGLGRIATLFKITIPQAFPSIFTGLKVSITLAVVGAIVAEIIGAKGGLGYLLLVAQGQLQTDLMFATLIVITVMGLILYGVVSAIERFCIPWARR